MPQNGDAFQVELGETHLKWGEYRYTNSRNFIPYEVYIPIPRCYALSYDIYNSNKNNGADVIGKNIFNCTTYINNTIYGTLQLKASGCVSAGDEYAKNFSGKGNLKALSPWINACGIQVGDVIEVRFTSSINVELRKI